MAAPIVLIGALLIMRLSTAAAEALASDVERQGGPDAAPVEAIEVTEENSDR